MHIRPLLLLAPVVLAGTVFLATPQVARANNGMTETGTTSYEVIPSKNAVQVTIQISIHNETPNQATSTGYTYYYWNSTAISVEASAGAISATSGPSPTRRKLRKPPTLRRSGSANRHATRRNVIISNRSRSA